MQEGTGITKLAVAKYGLILAVVGVSVVACDLVTHCLDTYVVAVDVYTARAKLAMFIFVKLADVGVHVQKQE